MSRAAFFDAIAQDSTLNGLGINNATVFHNWAKEERPTATGPFVCLQWANEAKPVWGSEPERGPRELTAWVHVPLEITNDFNEVTAVMNAIDAVADGLRDVAGSDGYTLSFVRLGGRSGDLTDDKMNTITRNAGFSIYQTLTQGD